MFGNTKVKKQDETTNFNPQSIYALAKVSAFYICNLYKKVHNLKIYELFSTIMNLLEGLMNMLLKK